MAIRGPIPATAFSADRLRDERRIFVDVFDTILVRKVAPDATKQVFSRQLAIALGVPRHAERIFRLRLAVEEDVRRANSARGFDAEFCFDEPFCARLEQAIFANIPSCLPSTNGSLRIGEFGSFYEGCLAIELAIETKYQVADMVVWEELRRLKVAGAELYCVSDFYHGAKIIRRLLEAAGLEPDLFDHYYVSADFLLRKASGRLYRKILEERALASHDIVMIGDNEHSDRQVPQELGLRAVTIDRSVQRGLYKEWTDIAGSRRRVAKSIRTLLAVGAGRKAEAPFRRLALTLFAFTEELFTQLCASGAQAVFFLSREGLLLKRLFDIYQDAMPIVDGSRIRSHYLLVSRRSTFLGSLGDPANESFDSLLLKWPDLSLMAFLRNLSFPDEEAREIASAIGVSSDDVIKEFAKSAALHTMRLLPAFSVRFAERRDLQRRNLLTYLASLGEDLSQVVHLVDVGWRGTIQDHIFRIGCGRLSLSGHYLGLIDEGGAGPGNAKAGVLFQLTSGNSRFAEVYNENWRVFEEILAAPHGGVVSYENVDGKILPKMDAHEGEEQFFKETIQPVQAGIVAAFTEIARIFAGSGTCAQGLEGFIARNHAVVTWWPSEAEVELFGRLVHYENFGAITSETYRRDPGDLWAKIARVGIRSLEHLQPNRSRAWATLRLRQLGLGLPASVYGAVRYISVFGRPWS